MIFGNYQNYSFRYDPEKFTFSVSYHQLNDSGEKAFLSGKVSGIDGSCFRSEKMPQNDVQWSVSSRCNIISYLDDEEQEWLRIIFDIDKDRLKIHCSANAVIKGEVLWGEDVADVFSGVWNDSSCGILRSSSGPAVRAGDNMLFDRRNDRALLFVNDGTFKYRFDWEKNAYCFQYSGSSADNAGVSFRIRENFVAQNMNMRYTPIDKKNMFPTPPVGWMTWYATKFDACEAEVLENTAKLKELLGNYADKLVSWVDWEWYHRNLKGDGAGDGNVFEPCKEAYPHGLDFVAEKIRETGVIPAVWVGLTCEGNKNKWFKAHPDCIIGPYPRWCGQWWINPCKKEVLEEYVPMVMKQLTDWGFHVVKWDCQTITSYIWEEYWDELGAPDKTPDQLEHAVIAAGRKALGDDVFLLLCNPVAGHDIAVGSDLCDAARIGADIFKWEEFVEHAIDHLFHFYPLHNTMLYADCDNIVLRREFNTPAQARSRVSFYGISGVPLTIGDRFREYDDELIGMLRRIVPVVDMNPVELVSRKPAGNFRRFIADFCRKSGSWQVMSITNIDSENDLETTVDLAEDCRLETGNGQNYAVYDYWNSRLVGVFESSFFVRVPAGDTAVLRITPVENDGLPTLVSSSRHLTQGGYELLDMERSRSEKSLCGTVLCAAGEPCRLSFLVPGNMEIQAWGGKWEQNGKVGILTVENVSGGETFWKISVR